MGNIQRAIEIIEEAKTTGASKLDLGSLNLTSGDLSSLMPAVKQISSLEVFILKDNQLDTLPEEIGDLTNLRDLNIGKNNFTVLPEAIGKLTKLEFLEAFSNKLTDLPASLAGAGNLKGLYLEENQFRTLPEVTTSLTELTTLCLHSNMLANLPEDMVNLVRLENLNLSNNEFTILPEFITSLSELKALNLESNGLVSLPDQIGDLANLSELNISNNHLSSLPQSIGDLILLEKLYVFNNQLATLPQTLENCVELEEMTFSGNPLSEEARNWVAENFGYNIPAADMEEYQDLELIEDVLDAIYEEKADQILSKIEAEKEGQYEVRPNVTKTKQEVLKEFLMRVPIHDPMASEIYNPMTKSIFDTIFNPEIPKEEKENLLHEMAPALDNCATPVRIFLVRKAIGESIGPNGEIPENLKVVVQREAVEESIEKSLKEYLKADDMTEQVQGLVNTIFHEDAENNSHNSLVIKGDRNRTPSKTGNIDFAFQQITTPLAEAFAQMYCKTDEEGTLLRTKEGAYLLDIEKLNLVIDKYFAGLGILSDREKLVQHFENDITKLIKENELEVHVDNKEVLPLLETYKQKQELRRLLHTMPDTGIEQAFNDFLIPIKKQIIAVGKKIRSHGQELSGMTLPLNQEQVERPQTPVEASAKRKASDSEKESKIFKRSKGL